MKQRVTNLHVKWCKPLDLIDGSKEGLIYKIDGIDQYEKKAGVYMFCRMDTDRFLPLYIGKSTNIALRTKQHLNEIRLMKNLQKRKNCKKVLIIGLFIRKRKQSPPNWISFIEDVLIKKAIENEIKLINKRGVTIKKHRIKFSGYTGGCEIFGKLINC